MLYPILLSDGKTEIPVELIELLHQHNSLCDDGQAQSDETKGLKRQIEIGLAALGMEWSTEDAVLCGHPYYARFSKTRFFVSPDGGHEHYGIKLISYKEACRFMDEANEKYKVLGKYSDVARICAMTEADLSAMSALSDRQAGDRQAQAGQRGYREQLEWQSERG